MLEFHVNEEKCIRCKKCVDDCPAGCMLMEEGMFPCIPDEEQCFSCQHCLAICPTEAISIMGFDPQKSLDIPYNLPTARSMETLVKGRRSIRRFKKQSVDIETIEEILTTAWHAPTGTNAQAVLFTTTVTAEATAALSKEIFIRLEKMIAELDDSEDSLPYQYMRLAHELYTEKGIDIILRGAPHIVIASAPRSVPLPKEDCIIALTTFELLAVSNGLGTLWDGMLTWCLKDFFPELAQRLGVPEDHQIGYAMLFGNPAVTYERTVQRVPATMNFVTSF